MCNTDINTVHTNTYCTSVQYSITTLYCTFTSTVDNNVPILTNLFNIEFRVCRKQYQYKCIALLQRYSNSRPIANSTCISQLLRNG